MTETQAAASARAAEAGDAASRQGGSESQAPSTAAEAPASGTARVPGTGDGRPATTARSAANPSTGAAGSAPGPGQPNRLVKSPSPSTSSESVGPATGRAVVGRVALPGPPTGARGALRAGPLSFEESTSGPRFTRAPGMPPPPDTPGFDASADHANAAVTADPASSRAAFAAGDVSSAQTGVTAMPGMGRVTAGAGTPTAGQPASGSARVTAAVRAARATVSSAAGRGPRRARLHIKRIDPWSTMKFSFAVSLVLFFVAVVATSVLYLALDAMGVFDAVNKALGELVGNTGGEAGDEFKITAKAVVGGSALVGAVNVVLFTALATLGAFIYNVCADLVGGIELTLAEKD